MLDCRTVSHHVASNAIDELPIRTRIQLRLHLMMCVHCRRYERQMRALAKGLRRRMRGDAVGDAAQRDLVDRIVERFREPPGEDA